MIYFFNFPALSPSTQSYTVDQTSMIFAINNTGTLSTTSSSGIVGKLSIKRKIFNFHKNKLGLTSSLEPSAEPLFGPYYISCRGNQISTFQMGNGLSGLNAIIIIFRIQNSTNPILQTILSFQSSSETLYQIQYSNTDKSLLFTSSAGSIRTATNTIIPGSKK